jgi:hypothetical protein
MRLAGIALGMTFIASATNAQAPSGTTSLAALRDQARPLLIFAAKPTDAQLEIQLRTLKENAPAIQDRQIVPVAIVYNNPSPTQTNFSPTEAEDVRRRFNIPPADFAVILIGKDGGEKLRSSKPLSMEKLSSTIDAMPMRRHEMQRPSR